MQEIDVEQLMGPASSSAYFDGAPTPLLICFCLAQDSTNLSGEYEGVNRVSDNFIGGAMDAQANQRV